MWHPFKRKREPVFTGNCFVRLYTMDNHYMGPCWHSTYDGVCHVHGDVTEYLSYPKFAAWPTDYQLAGREKGW